MPGILYSARLGFRSCPSVNSIFSKKVMPRCWDRRAGQLRLEDARIHRRARIGNGDEAQYANQPGLGIDLDLGRAAANHPERRRVRGLAGGVVRRGIARQIAAAANDRAGLHPVFAPEQLRARARELAVEWRDIFPISYR
jgi:hypothetical protein